MRSYFNANPQHQWKVLADKQYEQSKLRQAQQAQIQRQLKKKYLQQLSDQIKVKKNSINFQKRVQKSVDKLEIQRSVQNQKRMIQIQKLKNNVIQQKTNKIDNQNNQYQRQKKQRQRQIRQLQNQIQKSKNDQTQMLLNYQKEKQQKKKQYFRQFLKQTMEQQKQKKRLLQLRQRQYQKATLRQMQKIQQHTDDQRHKALENLKQRGRKVDYGSHSIFQANQNKTLLQRKSEEWQTYKDAIQRQQILKKMQAQQRVGRKVMQNYYAKQIKNQLQQRQQQKRQKQRFEIERDRSAIKQAERFGWMVQQNKRQIENQKKRLLYGYLQKQEQQKSMQKRYQNAMKQQQMKMNSSALINPNSQKDISPVLPRDRKSNYSTLDAQNSHSRYYLSKPTPGDTFRLDPYRIKQLETVSKSLKPQANNHNQKVQIDLRSHRYFASKGLNVLN